MATAAGGAACCARTENPVISTNTAMATIPRAIRIPSGKRMRMKVMELGKFTGFGDDLIMLRGI